MTLVLPVPLLYAQALYKVTGAILEHQELDGLLQTVVDVVASALPADRVTAILFDADRQAVTHFARGGVGAQHVVHVSF